MAQQAQSKNYRRQVDAGVDVVERERVKLPVRAGWRHCRDITPQFTSRFDLLPTRKASIFM